MKRRPSWPLGLLLAALGGLAVVWTLWACLAAPFASLLGWMSYL